MLESLMFQLTIKILFGFVSLLISVRVIGKRQVQQITPFDFVSAVVLGEILGNTLFDQDANLFYMLYALVLWTILSLIIENVTLKSRKLRRVIQGSPALIIKDGIIDYQVMKKEKKDFNELISLLREKDVFSVKDVAYAFIETSGSITVMKKVEKEYPTLKDLDIKKKPTSLTLALVLDGEIIKENLQIVGLTEEWLKNKFKQHQIKDETELVYAELNDSNDIYYQRK